MATLVLALAGSAHAEVTWLGDKDEWFATVGPVTTIDFTGFPDGTSITDQYSNLGVLFTGGGESISCCADSIFPNDGAGLTSHSGIHLAFLDPQESIALDFTGAVQFELYSEGELTYTSPEFGVGTGIFVGLVSTEPFDMAVIFDPLDSLVVIDDLHFGVPAPSSLAALSLGLLLARRRRQRSAS
jgi:hypothetical protein